MDFLKDLMDYLNDGAGREKKKEQTVKSRFTIAHLSESEKDDHRSMTVDAERIFSELRKLEFEKSRMNKRAELFWANLRYKYKCIEVERLIIEDDFSITGVNYESE